MEVKRISYDTISINGITVKGFKRIYEIITFKNYVIIRLSANEGDKNFEERYNHPGGNVFCYDAKGALLWQWHEKGISGMRLVDQEYIEEQRRSINTIRETLLEKGYSEDKIVAKDYVNPLLHPEGQVILCHAGPSYDSLVEIATGKELDRWETR